MNCEGKYKYLGNEQAINLAAQHRDFSDGSLFSC